MKDTFKKIDIIYLLGIIITIIGIFFNDKVYLSGDTLFRINELFIPLVTNIFIYGGISVILIEMFLTKNILFITNFVISQDRWFLSIVVISIIIYALSLLLAPAGGFILLVFSFIMFAYS